MKIFRTYTEKKKPLILLFFPQETNILLIHDGSKLSVTKSQLSPNNTQECNVHRNLWQDFLQRVPVFFDEHIPKSLSGSSRLCTLHSFMYLFFSFIYSFVFIHYSFIYTFHLFIDSFIYLNICYWLNDWFTYVFYSFVPILLNYYLLTDSFIYL